MNRPERGQARGSEETRATHGAIAEIGNPRTSTIPVAQRAEMERDALSHQFSTRDNLPLAAVQSLLDGWRGGSALRDRAGRVADFSRLSWFDVSAHLVTCAIVGARTSNNGGASLQACQLQAEVFAVQWKTRGHL